MESNSSPAAESVEIRFSVSAADQAAFADLSGDHNPLHLDPAFARGVGLQGAVVYGGMLVAKISQIIGMRLPGPRGIWAALKVDFRDPLYVDESAVLSAQVTHISEAVRSMTVRIRITCDERLIATATATATLHAPAP